RSPRPASSRIAATRSGLRTQHAQPSLISTRASVAGASSIPATPRSFCRTPTRRPEDAARRRLRRVVFPAPRNPVTRVTGSGEATRSSVRERSGLAGEREHRAIVLPAVDSGGAGRVTREPDEVVAGSRGCRDGGPRLGRGQRVHEGLAEAL